MTEEVEERNTLYIMEKHLFDGMLIASIITENNYLFCDRRIGICHNFPSINVFSELPWYIYKIDDEDGDSYIHYKIYCDNSNSSYLHYISYTCITIVR